jgi:hypothetical protein
LISGKIPPGKRMNMRLSKLLGVFLFFVTAAAAQDVNKIIIDEESEKPMLIGYTTREAFKDTNFAWWFDSEYEMYEPDPASLPELKEKMNGITVTIAMGSWCSDSRREVPRFLKITDAISYSSDKITFINVNREKTAEIKKVTGEAEQFTIDFVPTIFFYRDNKEIGRIEEMPRGTLESDMLQIIK